MKRSQVSLIIPLAILFVFSCAHLTVETRDIDTDKPISGLEVKVKDYQNHLDISEKTGSDGRVIFSDIKKSGKYSIVIEGSQDYFKIDTTIFDYNPKQPLALSLQSIMTIIEGTVADTSEILLENCEIKLDPDRIGSSVYTDTMGHFVIKSKSITTDNYNFQVTKEGYKAGGSPAIGIDQNRFNQVPPFYLAPMEIAPPDTYIVTPLPRPIYNHDGEVYTD